MQTTSAGFSGLQIGNYWLARPVLLAPMAGITDAPFRRIAARFGAGLVVSEMVASAALATGQDLMVRKLERAAGMPHAVQLAGCEPYWMGEGARLAVAAGADIIDINFGCPAKRVTAGLAGSALMREPDQAIRIVEAVLEASEGRPVTVKMRLGWDEDALNAAELASRCQAAGVAMVTVHGRTRQQFYKGSARWHLVKTVAEAVSIPLVVNGDVTDLRTARKALAQSGAQAVMVGRGAQGRPWIVGQLGAALAGCAPPSTPQGASLAELVAEHYEGMLTLYGVDVGRRAARKHLGWYADALDSSLDRPTRALLLEGESPADVLRTIRSVFDAEVRQAA